MVTIRAPGVLGSDTLARPTPDTLARPTPDTLARPASDTLARPAFDTLVAANETSIDAEGRTRPIDKAEGFCPRCGMHYRFIDGVLYPQRHGGGQGHAYSVCHKGMGGKGGRVCDACHLEEAMRNITARRALNAIVQRTITHPSLKRQILIPERKRRLISSISETIGSFALSRQEISNVIDLCSDVEMATTLLADAVSIKASCDFTVDELKAVLAGAHQRLGDYIANLDDRKRHDLYSMMLLGRNLDYYGLCQEAVVEFKLRTDNYSSNEGSAGMYHSAERIAEKQDLKNWLKLVLDLVEG